MCVRRVDTLAVHARASFPARSLAAYGRVSTNGFSRAVRGGARGRLHSPCMAARAPEMWPTPGPFHLPGPGLCGHRSGASWTDFSVEGTARAPRNRRNHELETGRAARRSSLYVPLLGATDSGTLPWRDAAGQDRPSLRRLAMRLVPTNPQRVGGGRAGKSPLLGMAWKAHARRL